MVRSRQYGPSIWEKIEKKVSTGPTSRRSVELIAKYALSGRLLSDTMEVYTKGTLLTAIYRIELS